MPQRAIEVVAAAVLVIGCIFGGSSAAGRTLLAAPQLLSLPLLVLAAVARDRAAEPARSRWAVAGLILALPLLQLVPLPPEVWARLPGRGSVVEAYSAAGLPSGWLPVSLTPSDTWRFWLALLPPVALFLAISALDRAARRRLVHVAVALGVFSAVLGLAQIAGGQTSPLRLYEAASRDDAVGLFANRNHHATFLAVLIVFAGALATADRPIPLAERAWLAVAGLLMLAGVAASGSRAGLLLGLAACLAAVWIVARGRPSPRRGRSLLVWSVAAVAPLLVVVALFGGALLRVGGESVADDLRWRIAGTAWRALVDVFPVGGGFGGFERLYARAEGPGDVIPQIVNNAHDDWLELVVEGGLPALILLVCALAYLLRATVRPASGVRDGAARRALATAALAALWLAAVHSIVDYPLRSLAVALVFALACGLRTRPVPGLEPAVPRAWERRVRATAAPALSRGRGR